MSRPQSRGSTGNRTGAAKPCQMSRTSKIWIDAGLFTMLGMLASCSTMKRSEDIRALEIGRIELAGLKATVELPPVERVEINLFMFGGAAPTNAARFPVQFAGFTSNRKIQATQTLVGNRAAEFLDAWRSLHTCWGFSALCHEPAYGLRFFNGDKLALETSVCFKCCNFSVQTPSGHVLCGFNPTDRAGTKVFFMLTNSIPLPPSRTGESKRGF